MQVPNIIVQTLVVDHHNSKMNPNNNNYKQNQKIYKSTHVTNQLKWYTKNSNPTYMFPQKEIKTSERSFRFDSQTSQCIKKKTFKSSDLSFDSHMLDAHCENQTGHRVWLVVPIL